MFKDLFSVMLYFSFVLYIKLKQFTTTGKILFKPYK